MALTEYFHSLLLFLNMKNRAALLFILLITLLDVAVLKGQMKENGFLAYASHQSELMHNAYQAR